MLIFFILNFPFVWEFADKMRNPAIKAAHYGMIFANSLNDENFSTCIPVPYPFHLPYDLLIILP
jgi:hypothetical protein